MNKKSYIPTFLVLYVGAFVAAFNENLMNVALLDICEDFHVSPTSSQWLVTGYMIVTAIVVAGTAFLMKRIPARILFLIASLSFLGGHICAILVPNSYFSILLAARLLQAIGSGVFIPLMMNAVVHMAPKEKVGTFLSFGNAVLILGPAIAPVISGLAVSLFGWRAVFVFPACIVLILLVLAKKYVINFQETTNESLDVASLILLALGITSFVYGISVMMHDLLLGAVIGVAGLLILVLFFMRSTHVSYPLLNVAVLKNSRFLMSVVLVVIAMMMSFSLSVLMPLFSESVFAQSALMAGILLLPAIIMNSITAIFAGKIFDRLGSWPLIPSGFALVFVGQIFIVYAAFSVEESTSSVIPLVIAIVASTLAFGGIGFILAPVQSAGLSVLTGKMRPDGISVINTSMMIAASVGPALYVSMMDSIAGEDPSPYSSAQGFGFSMIVGIFVALLGFCVSIYFALKEKSSKRKNFHQASQNAHIIHLSGDSEIYVRDVMNKDPYYVARSDTVRRVIEVLAENKTSGVPIVNAERKVIGFVSDGDIMVHLAQVETKAHFDLGLYIASVSSCDAEEMENMNNRISHLLDTPVSFLMQEDVVVASPSMPLEELATRMSKKHMKKMPVVDVEGILVGSISRSDIVRGILRSFT
ncbi:MAG: MFS transporter [Actinomycetaceae bacterium]|nr:MFS transporter [Actinomycetaceae bacterium]